MVAPSEVYVRAVWRDVGLNQTGLRRGGILIERFGGTIRLAIVDCQRQRPVETRAGISSLSDPREAFERLTQARLDRAYRLAATILDQDAEAQDAVHDAAVQAWTRWATLREENKFDAWFDRIVVNVCRDRLRRSATAARKLVETTPTADPSDRTGWDDSLRLAVASLSPDHNLAGRSVAHGPDEPRQGELARLSHLASRNGPDRHVRGWRPDRPVEG
jgi:RNA polymerase sigma factor (sigma-70 family)